MHTPSIGGYVIHGNNAATLPRCLDALQQTCDQVVAIDSQSSDGSADLVDARGIPRIVYPWQGYGAARARAVQALGNVDYIFFMDSDEVLEDPTPFALWRQSQPALPHYTVRRRDWVVTPQARFVFRTETRKRLVRRDAATWAPDMIVHEALPKRPSAPLGATIDHQFCTDPRGLAAKLHVYALLWAVRYADARAHSPTAPALQRLGYMLRNALLKGAWWRGGTTGLQVSWAVADYHLLKYRYRAALQAGVCDDLLQAFRDGEYAAVYRAAPAAVRLMQAVGI